MASRVLRSNTRSKVVATRSATATASTSTATTSSKAKIKTFADASTQTIACPPAHGGKRSRNASKVDSPVECQICWEPIGSSIPMGFLENCTHVFCAPCLVTWNTTHDGDSIRHQRCPVCRSSAKRVLLWPRPFESSQEKDTVVAFQKRWIKKNYVSQSDNTSSLRNILINDANLLGRYMNLTANRVHSRADNEADIPPPNPDILVFGHTPRREVRVTPVTRSRPGPPTLDFGNN